MTTMTIKGNHRARVKIADLPNYFDSKGTGFCAVDDVLREYGMELDWDGLNGYLGDENHRVFDIRKVADGGLVCDSCNKAIEETDFNNCVYISWYKMPSGCYEIVAYIT